MVITRTPPPTTKDDGRESPARTANFFSTVFFSWIDPLIKKGYRKELEQSDLYRISEDNSSEYLSSRLEKEWKREVASKSIAGKKPSYLWVLLRCFKWRIIFVGMFAFMEETARVVQPLLLAQMLDYFRTSSRDSTSNSSSSSDPEDAHSETIRAYMYALGLALTSAFTAITHHPLYFYSLVEGMRMKVASCAIIYRKTLRLSHRSLATTTTGHIVNLMSTDVARLEYCLIFIHYLWLAPLQAAVVLAILWTHIGPASLSGYALVLLLTPVQGLLGKVYAKLRLKTAVQSDERIRLMDQVVAGMKVIKMYCWEKPFAELIAAVRAREMSVIGIGSRIRLMSMELGYFSFSKITMGSCIIAYVLIYGRAPRLETVLVLMRLIGTVQDCLAYNMTRAISIWGEMASTCTRIQDFLLLAELEEEQSQLPCKLAETAAVELRSFSGKWEGGSGALVLKDVTARAASGELLAVVGPVGSGKSSLLMAALGELPPTSGEVTVRGRVAYASQQPWIFSASLKQNILFGLDFDADKYQAVVEACALSKDIELLAHGDETLVGERGVILSGGQRARVGLARAVYQDADIYLLDDPLSAVDASVAKHLFHKCISGILKGRACVLVTHQLHFLQSAARVLVLVGGEVKGFGTYSELMQNGVDFVELLKHEPGSGEPPSSPEAMPSRQLLFPRSLPSLQAARLRSLSTSAAEASIRSSLPDLLGPEGLHLSASQLASCDDDADEAGCTELHHGRAVSARDLSASATRPLAKYGEPGVDTCAASLPEDSLLLKAQDAKGPASPSDEEELEPERTEKGKVALSTYWMYFRAGGNTFVLLIVLLLVALGQASFMVIDWYITRWAHTEDIYQMTLIGLNLSTSHITRNASVPPLGSILVLANSSDRALNLSAPSDVGYDEETRKLMTKVYAVLLAVLIVLSCSRTFAFYQLCMNASKSIHNLMFSTIVRTPMRFFDINPVGRILNRFSRDIGTVDDQLPLNFFDFFTCVMLVSGTVMMTAIANPWVLLPLVPIVIVLVFIYRLYVSSSRAIKRLEGITRSPMFSHLSSTLSGLQTVRAYRAQIAFTQEFDQYQDGHTEAFYLFLCVTRWLAIRLDWISVVFVTSVTFLCLIAKDNLNLSADLVGLAITYTMALMGLFQWMVRQSTEIESMMTSVERIAEYTRLEPEAPLVTSVRPPPGWPRTGCMNAEDVSLRYSPSEPLVLHNVCFHIKDAEKIGICGRTGAGKSSLLAMLFRLCEPSGRVFIDDVCISDIGLHDLRSKLSIIPQDPVLFSTTVRGNLDPFSGQGDAKLWDALRQVQLAAAVQELPGGLDAPIAEGGANFSVGQRQLICLARAMLRQNRILVVDEATANVDPRTDATIQETIKDKFKDCTVLTIAHRLNTIMDSDRVMVLEGGTIREFDEPHILLQQTDSLFRDLVKHTGKGYDHLCAMAKASHDKRMLLDASTDRQA